MASFKISLADGPVEIVEANYFVFEDDFLAFKADKHEVVAAYPKSRVQSIRRAKDESRKLSDSVKVDYTHAKFIISAPVEISFEVLENAIERAKKWMP